MKKAVWPVLAAALLAAGCGRGSASGEWNANINSVYVAKDQSVKSALVYTSDQFNELYDQEELSAFVDQAVADYNAESGGAETPVTVESCTLEGRSGTVVFSYASPEDFVNFSQATGDDTHTVTALQVGDAPGTAPDTAYRTPSGKAASYEDVCKKENTVAVRISGSSTVFTEGKILYASEGTSIEGDYRAKTPEGENNCIIFKK